MVGQASALEVIVPSVQLHLSGLAPVGRPVGVFLLLGPTGTGKTRTVEALAEVLHGSRHKLLRIDCGEFQGDHEIAKPTIRPGRPAPSSYLLFVASEILPAACRQCEAEARRA